MTAANSPPGARSFSPTTPSSVGCRSAFEQLDPSNPPERNCTLAEELEFRTRRMEELDRHTARERMRERARRVQDEGAFWRETAEFLAADEAMRIDDLPDPAAEIEEEALIQEQRIARLPDPDGQRFWDETLELLQREAAQRIFPDELRRADGEG